ncbi:kinase-like domain-containing protein [Thelephora terrestris]|uniref:Kinase-like domain-containing protein n=1 Tax=Thelephora terrestris TaxID=56493 RepID=A0A9P6LAI3_9AGAM|nr:kinase-like domain-containing protein [Thelephora terrestris]
MSDELQGLPSHNFPPITDEDLARLEVDPQLIPFAVSTAQRAEQSSSGEPQLTPTEAENLVEILDRVVSSDTVNPGLKNRCFKVLRKVSPAHGILPKSYYLVAVTLLDSIPYASGGFADIWKGQMDGRQVCVKAFRTQTTANLTKIKRRFYRDIIGWKYIAHPNVVSFFGVSEALFSFCIISPWLSNGNILEYIRKNQRVNRLTLLAQAASGLEYLHSLGIVHSDVNPGNILIDDDGSACLGDFGITAVITDPSVVEPGSTTTSKAGVVRYMAPELLHPSQFNLKNSNPTKESDIYSLAVTSYEVLAGVLPYGNNRDGIIIFHVVSGDRPPRPENTQWLRDQIWDMITKCWSEQRETRWDIRTVVHQLSVSSIQEVAEAQRDVQMISRSLHVVEDPSPSPPPPPRRATMGGQSSLFVEEPSLPNTTNNSAQRKANKGFATRGGSGRAKSVPSMSLPKAFRRPTFPFPLRSNQERLENFDRPQTQRPRKLAFWKPKKGLRNAVNVIRGILRMKKLANHDDHSPSQ